VLERIARAAGAVAWYELRTVTQLPALAARLHPASRVSFYFDNRLRFRAVDGSFVDDYLAWGPEAVVGLRTSDELELEVGAWTGLDDLTAFLGPLFGPSTQALLGPYPASDDDGEDAVTLVLPDADGQVRAHPH
jgi:hypothetical protein